MRIDLSFFNLRNFLDYVFQGMALGLGWLICKKIVILVPFLRSLLY